MKEIDLDLDRLAESARSLIIKGREAERLGRPDEARRCFEEALEHLDPSDARAGATLMRWIAWAYAKSGNAEAALDCLEVSIAVAEENGDNRALASALNTRAGTLFNLGELDEAEALFQRVLGLSWEIGDRKLQAMAEQNLGSVASIRGDIDVALQRFQSALRGYESLGLTDYVGPLLNNIGRLQTDLGRDAEAALTLARARDLCVEEGDRHHHVMVEVNRARLLLRSGQHLEALEAGEAARQLTAITGDERWMSDIDLVTGSAYARLASPEIALCFLKRAAATARARRNAKVLADVVLEQAGVFRQLGRNPETLQRLNEAHRIFQRLRARRELADVDDRLANLEAIFLDIVREWGESIESKDAYTQGHCSRVSDIACLLAEESGLPAEDMTWFRMGGLLHDVGKVAVPLSILNKPGPLDDEERAVMSTHPVAGIELLEDVDFPWDVRPMIRHHHERWDGTGYPDRIGGHEIPRAARILTVADIYDALTSDRAYRPGFAHEDAMDIMASEVGKTLDPELFPLFAESIAPRLPDLLGVASEPLELARAM